MVFENCIVNDSKANSFTKRYFSKTNLKHFIRTFSDTNWDSLLSAENVNEAYCSFLDRVLKLYDECIPERIVKARFNKK